jgi:hypothetical protein
VLLAQMVKAQVNHWAGGKIVMASAVDFNKEIIKIKFGLQLQVKNFY